MQKLPVYLYPNLFVIQLDLDYTVKGINNTMYQRELKIQKGLKNKVQIQFKNSDQKNIRIKATTTLAESASTDSSYIVVSDIKGIQVGMLVDDSNFQAGTYVSDISGNTITLSNLDPQYDPFDDSFNSPILTTVSSGTSLSFNHNFVFSMFDSEQQRMITQKTLDIIDDGVTTATKGLALLELTEDDTRGLDTSYYKFGITLTDYDGRNIPTYSNTYYDIHGSIKLTHDLWPVLKDSQAITSFQRFANEDTNLYEFNTGNLRSYPDLSQTTTAAYYLNNFTGTVKVQATLDNTPSTFANYVTVSEKTYSNFTGVDYANAEGNWSDVRVVWIPDASDLPGLHNFYSPEMPGNPTPGSAYYPNGKIDRVLVRS